MKLDDPFTVLRDWNDSAQERGIIADEVHDELVDILADLDPADDGSPFGWGSQACASEPEWAREEGPLRELVVVHRMVRLSQSAVAAAAFARSGFAWVGKNVNWMSREELLEEAGYKSWEQYVNDPRTVRALKPRVTYTIDYRSPPGGIGHIELADGTVVHVPYENEETGDFSSEYELAFIRQHGVTHVFDSELDVERTGPRDPFAAMDVEQWLSFQRDGAQ